jgi:hypothetical protein
MPLFGASNLWPRSVRDECLKATVYVDVQAKQKIERWRVDWSEQRLPRSPWTVDPDKTRAAANLRLTVEIQELLARRAWNEKEVRARDLNDRRAIPGGTLTIHARKVFSQLCPTRRKAIWSKLLSLKNPDGRQFHARLVGTREVSRGELLVKDDPLFLGECVPTRRSRSQEPRHPAGQVDRQDTLG